MTTHDTTAPDRGPVSALAGSRPGNGQGAGSPPLALVYDVDEAILGRRKYVRVRGRDYPISDLKVEDRLLLNSEYQRLTGALTEQEEAGKQAPRDQWEAWRKAGIQLMVDGMDDATACQLTEREFTYIQRAWMDARGLLEHERVEGQEKNLLPVRNDSAAPARSSSTP